MDDKTLEHIFEPFFTTKDISQGTGMGLASAYGIVTAHGGYIGVDSKIGRGTTFHVYLPISSGAVAKEVSRAAENIRRTGRILFVDDDDTIRELGGEMLKSLGYEPLVADSGAQALEIYSAQYKEIDMVILDMVMPDMSGGVVFDQLRGINPQVKVLLSSGYSVDGKATEILNRGCNGFIQKPFKVLELANKIIEIL